MQSALVNYAIYVRQVNVSPPSPNQNLERR